jgi:hypothetical protein
LLQYLHHGTPALYYLNRRRNSLSIFEANAMNANSIAATTADLLSNHFKSLQYLAQYRQSLIAAFNESELRNLCFDMGIDFEELSATNKSGKVRELIAYCLRRGCLFELLSHCARLRPNTFPPPDPTVPIIENKNAVMRAAQVCESVQNHLSRDSYANQTIEQLADQPESKSRYTILMALLTDFIEEHPALAQELRRLLGMDHSAGDTIKQDVTIQDHAQPGDINVVGKVEGGSLVIGKRSSNM